MSHMFLGVDTSNYTTSVAITDGDGRILSDKRKLLIVKEGARGLRQSDALFLHIKNLPELIESLDVDMKNICGVGVSFAPRNIPGSYMPVFLGGSGAGRMIAKSLSVPYYEFSHQEGHIRAGLYQQSCEDGEFYSVHMSGGTTEILKVQKQDAGFKTQIVGKTLDISVGQLIDRTGVRLGFIFPCGKAMDEICSNGSDVKIPPVCVKGSEMNLSGTETQFLRLIEEGVPAPEIAYLVFSAIAEALIKSILHVFKEYGRKHVLFVGGVASNSIIRNKIENALSDDAFFSMREYSTDNAVGISLLTGEAFKRGL
ncbi:MAG: hypothetical protein E7407_01890 [Ruminococcaceae bacterium]|nr:hypothetical protein [Oscillospiraceae bacterium]